MDGNGTLTGLTPKDTAAGQFIEIKIVARFRPEILTELGKLFGQQVNFQIESQVQDLDFEDGESGEDAVLDIEQMR